MGVVLVQHSDSRKYSAAAFQGLWNTIETLGQFNVVHSLDGSFSVRIEGPDMEVARAVKRLLQDTECDVIPVTDMSSSDHTLTTERREIEIFNSIQIGNLHLSGCGYISADSGRPVGTLYAHGACVVFNKARQFIAREVMNHRTLIMTDLSLLHLWVAEFGNRRVRVVHALTKDMTLQSLRACDTDILICSYSCFYPKHATEEDDITFDKWDRFVLDAPYPEPVYPCIRRIVSHAEHTWMCMPGFSRFEPTTLSWVANVLVGNAPVAVFPTFEKLVHGYPRLVQPHQLSIFTHTVVSDCSAQADRASVVDNNLSTQNDELFKPRDEACLRELLLAHSGMNEASVDQVIKSIAVNEDSEESCPICFSEAPQVVTMCGHAYCVECAYKIINKSCGVCRRTINHYYSLYHIILEPAKIRKLNLILADVLLKRVFVVVSPKHAKRVSGMLEKKFSNVYLMQGPARRRAGHAISKAQEKFIIIIPFNFCTTLLAENVDRVIFVHPWTHRSAEIRSVKHHAMVQRLTSRPCAVDMLVCEDTVETALSDLYF